MTTTDVAVRADHAPAAVRLSAEQLQYIAQTEFVPKSMRGKLPAIMACVAYGRELGLGDMVALNTVHVIDGRTSLSAEAMVSLVRQRGHSIQGNFSGDSCTVTGRRADNGDEMTVTWTREMAEQAGLLNKDNWRKYSPSMLWARAVSQLARMLFADCFAGNTYTPGEVPTDAEPFTVDDEPAAVEPRQLAVGQQGGAVAGVATGATQNASPAADVQVGAAEGLVGEPKAGVVDEPAPVSAAPSQDGEQPSPTITDAQKRKADVLVGTLRDGGHLTTEQLFAAVGRDEVLRDENDVARWSLLRETLTRDEASGLIDRLETYANNLQVTA